MRKIACCIILFCVPLLQTVKSQTVFEWAKQIGWFPGVHYHHESNSIYVDGSGNVYTTGLFEGAADFDPGSGNFYLPSLGGSDIFISKLDSSGNFIWAKRFGGDSPHYDYERGMAICGDDFGNIYCTGHFAGTGDFDPGIGVTTLTSAGSFDIFICKFDSSGNFLWATGIGSGCPDAGLAIAVDRFSNVYTTGSFTGAADFDPGPGAYYLSGAAHSIFVSKLDQSGNFVWAKNFPGTSIYELGSGIAIDSAGNVYTTGQFSTTIDFDPGPATFNLTPNNGYDTFVSKLDSSGNFVWVKQIGGNSYIQDNSIVIDTSNNIYISGEFNGNCDFDPGPALFNLQTQGGGFISKLDSSGNFIWAKAIDLKIYSISLDAFGYLYVIGLHEDIFSNDPSMTVISKFDNTGNLLWSKQFAGHTQYCFHENRLAIFPDKNGNVYSTGTFCANSAGPFTLGDFDPGTGIFNLSPSGEDIFIHKMSSCLLPFIPGIISGNSAVCAGSNNTYFISPVLGAESYIWSLPQFNNWTGSSITNSISAVAGLNSGNGSISVSANNFCGSSIPQSLTIDVSALNTYVSIIGNTLTANSNSLGTTYQWLNCPEFDIVAGEINQTFSPLVNGSYAVIATENGCIDTSLCYQVIGSGIQNASTNFQSNIILSPNPSSGRITIRSSHSTIDKIEIYNLLGEILFETTGSEADLSNLSNGLYFISVISNEKKVFEKMVKE